MKQIKKNTQQRWRFCFVFAAAHVANFHWKNFISVESVYNNVFDRTVEKNSVFLGNAIDVVFHECAQWYNNNKVIE